MAALLFLYSVTMLATLSWVEAQFGNDLAPDAIIFTVLLPKTGGYSLDLAMGYLSYLGPALLAAAGFIWLWRRLTRDPARALRNRRWLTAASLVCFLGANVYFEARHHLFSFFFWPRPMSTMYEDHYRLVAPEEVRFPDKKRNLIIVMMESIEETFNEEKYFGEKLMPELAKLREENTSFYGFRQTLGATWTIGGLTADLFGIPLTFPSGFGPAAVDLFVNAYGEKTAGFLPGARAIVTILEKHGYDVEFFLGSDDQFAGQGRAFTTHTQNAKIYDYKYFKQLKEAGEIWFEEKPFWGLPDPVLYDAVKRHLTNAKRDKPFFLLMQTLDTHLNDEYFNHLVPERWHDERDNLAEASLLAADFVRWVGEQDFGADTTVILIGDHLRNVDKVGDVDLPPQYMGREIYNVFINPVPQLADKAPHRFYATFDMAPTILESVGAVWPGSAFGLGVSLFSPGLQTLFESAGVDYYEDEVRKKSLFYESFFLGR